MATHPEAAALSPAPIGSAPIPRNTNYAGGNTSAKGTDTDPVTGGDVELMWVKGSGGDLGTLTEAGLAVLRLDRLRALTEVYPGVEREDEMVAAFDYCLHGKGGAAPSIDTAMHGLVDAAHVDHLHPDSGIALACAADGEKLTAECFGDRVVWVPWRRPGFQLGLDIAAVKAANPQAIGCVLGGHGITAWGDTAEECERELAAHHPYRRGVPRRAREGRAVRARCIEGYAALRAAERRERAAALAPYVRAIASQDRPQVGHFTDTEVVLDFLVARRAPAARRPRHLLPGPLPAHQGPAARPRPAADRPARRGDRPAARSCTPSTARSTPPTTSGTPLPDSPAMRGADPAIVLVPGVGMFSFGKDKQTARVAGEFYVNAINVMRGAEAVSTYAPIEESEKFRIEYWALEEAKLRRMPEAQAARHPGRAGDRRGHRDRQGRSPQRLAAEGACVVVADLDAESAAAGRRGAGRPRQGGRRHRGRHLRGADRRGVPGGRAGLRRRGPGGQQRGHLHLQAAAGDHGARTGTCSTTSWPAARSSSRARRPG